MRKPPDATRAAPGVSGNGPRKADHLGGLIFQIDGTNRPAIQESDIERADDLLALWHWRKNLAWRLRLAQLKFEYIGLDPDEQDALAVEVKDFRDVCAAMNGACAVGTAERRAA